MRITKTHSSKRMVTRYVLEIPDADLLNAHFDKFDRWLLAECDEGSVADILLGLETIARKIEEGINGHKSLSRHSNHRGPQGAAD